LIPEERGLVAGLALLAAGGEAARRVVGAGDQGARALGAWKALQAMGREQRAAALAELVRDVRTPLPARIEELHPSWLELVLTGEPPGLARAVVAGLPVGFKLAVEAWIRREAPAAHPSTVWALEPAALADVQRLLLGPLQVLTVDASGPLGTGLAAREAAELLAEVARRGARTLGTSLAGAPLPVRARTMAQAGAPWAEEIAAAASAAADDTDQRDRARDLVVAAAAMQPPPAPGTPEITPEERLRAVGVLVLARELAAEGPASVARVAGRLPFDLGRALLDAAGIRL
jgi:hypothetical protein